MSDSPAGPHTTTSGGDFDAPVIIAGAGPVGLALALGLARHGVATIVLEKDGQLKPFSRAVVVLGRTLEVLRDWDAIEEFLRAGDFRPAFEICDARTSRRIFKLDLRQLRDRLAVAGVLLLPQDRTEALLLELVQSTGLCQVHFDAPLSGIAQDADGVRAQFTHGDATTSLRGRFVVGCDGAHSMVRELMGLHLEGKTYPARMLLADIRLAGRAARLPNPRMVPGWPGLLVLVRFDLQRWRIISSLLTNETEDQTITAESLRTRVRLLAGDDNFELSWANTFRIHCRNAPTFRQGRVLLAGDAAHLNSPAGGMGMNSGIQDAHNLAWKLAAALGGGDSEALLDSYATERRGAAVGSVQRITDRLTSIMTVPGWLRLAAMRAFNALATVRPIGRRMGAAMSMLNTVYPPSPLISGDPRWSGRIAPDCEIATVNGDRQRVSELRGGKALLVCYDFAPPSCDAATLEIAREGNELFRRTWGVDGPFAALIRPDGYIGWAAVNPTGDDFQQAVKVSGGVCLL